MATTQRNIHITHRDAGRLARHLLRRLGVVVADVLVGLAAALDLADARGRPPPHLLGPAPQLVAGGRVGGIGLLGMASGGGPLTAARVAVQVPLLVRETLNAPGPRPLG
jgi:hypothetical protein